MITDEQLKEWREDVTRGWILRFVPENITALIDEVETLRADLKEAIHLLRNSDINPLYTKELRTKYAELLK